MSVKMVMLWSMCAPLFIRSEDLAVSFNLIDWYHWDSGTTATHPDKGTITFTVQEAIKIARTMEKF